MTRFPKYSESRASWGVANVPTVIVEIEDEEGRVGVGASCGGEAACFLIEQHLSQFVEGQNVRNISYIWEQCWRASIHYSRKGDHHIHDSAHQTLLISSVTELI